MVLLSVAYLVMVCHKYIIYGLRLGLVSVVMGGVVLVPIPISLVNSQ